MSVDPRCFGLGCARARSYGIAWKKSMFTWNQNISLERLIGALQARPIMLANDFFFLSDIPSSKLTSAEDTQSSGLCSTLMLTLSFHAALKIQTMTGVYDILSCSGTELLGLHEVLPARLAGG